MKFKHNRFTLMVLSGLMVLVLATAASAYYGNSSNMATSKTTVINDKEVSIAIKGFMFSPDNITIKPGTSVTWINNDDATHNIVVDKVTSPDLSKDAKWSYTFTKTGKFPYYCAFHSGMKATITVK